MVVLQIDSSSLIIFHLAVLYGEWCKAPPFYQKVRSMELEVITALES